MDAFWCGIIKTFGLPALAVFLLWIVLTQIRPEEYFKGKFKILVAVFVFKVIATIVVFIILGTSFFDARRPSKDILSGNTKPRTSTNK